MKKSILGALALVFIASPSFANVDVIFTSANHGNPGSAVAADKIIEVMGKAKKKIHIAVAHFNSDRITKALIDLHKARNTNDDSDDDIEIKVMLDLGEYGDKKSKSKRLEAAGIDVRYKTYSLAFFHPQSQLMHHKFMLVDDTDLITGSYNWSDTAEYKNYENILHYYRRNVKKVIAAFRGEFDKLWEMERDKFAPFLKAMTAKKGEDGYQRYVPIHFNNDYFKSPMSLTRSELRKIRSAASKLGVFSFRGNKFLDRETKKGTSVLPPGTFIPSAWQPVTESNPGSTPGVSSSGATGAMRDNNTPGSNESPDSSGSSTPPSSGSSTPGSGANPPPENGSSNSNGTNNGSGND